MKTITANGPGSSTHNLDKVYTVHGIVYHICTYMYAFLTIYLQCMCKQDMVAIIIISAQETDPVLASLPPMHLLQPKWWEPSDAQNINNNC